MPPVAEPCVQAMAKLSARAASAWASSTSALAAMAWSIVEAPWLKARGDLPLTAYSEEIIDKESLGKYFLTVKEKYHMVNPGDIRAYAEDMFRQSCVVPVG